MAPKMGLPWTNQSISTLIENYSQQNCLYDTKLTLYHNKNIRQKTLEDIALALESRRPNTTWQEVKVKIASLRTQFRVEHNKVKSSLKSGTSTDDVSTTSIIFIYVMYLVFLIFFRFVFQHFGIIMICYFYKNI